MYREEDTKKGRWKYELQMFRAENTLKGRGKYKL